MVREYEVQLVRIELGQKIRHVAGTEHKLNARAAYERAHDADLEVAGERRCGANAQHLPAGLQARQRLDQFVPERKTVFA